MISIVSPVYNSEKCLRKLVEKIFFYTNKVTDKFEIILVDDGSKDESWNKIIQLKKKYSILKGIKLSRNYGQHKAIYQGIKSSTGKLIIIMDCDLQDNPAFIVDMFNSYIREKKPVIIEHSYKNFKFRDRIVSNIFWYFLSAVSLKKFSPSLGNYLLIDDKIKKNYLLMKNIGYLYGDLITQGNIFFHIKKKRSHGTRQSTTYNYTKLAYLGIILILKYNILGNILRNTFSNFAKNRIKKISIARKI